MVAVEVVPDRAGFEVIFRLDAAVAAGERRRRASDAQSAVSAVARGCVRFNEFVRIISDEPAVAVHAHVRVHEEIVADPVP